MMNHNAFWNAVDGCCILPVTHIASATGVSKQRVGLILKKAVALGLLDQPARGAYRAGLHHAAIKAVRGATYGDVTFDGADVIIGLFRFVGCRKTDKVWQDKLDSNDFDSMLTQCVMGSSQIHHLPE